MGVEVIGVGGEINGHGDSVEAFRIANEQNSRALLNVAEGKKKNEPRPAYNPAHPDNQWPVMVYHAEKGELVVGKPLVGITDPRQRKQIEQDNEADMKKALAAGYRKEPYLKPQIAVLDPAMEKLEAKRKMDEQQGQINALSDQLQRLLAEKEAAKPAEAQKS